MEITVFSLFLKVAQQAFCAPMLQKVHVFSKKVTKTEIFVNSRLLSSLVSKIRFLKNVFLDGDEAPSNDLEYDFQYISGCFQVRFRFLIFSVFFLVRAKLL